MPCASSQDGSFPGEKREVAVVWERNGGYLLTASVLAAVFAHLVQDVVDGAGSFQLDADFNDVGLADTNVDVLPVAAHRDINRDRIPAALVDLYRGKIR